MYVFSSVLAGDDLELLNDLVFSDANLKSCVLSEAAANAWATADEVTSLSCINAGITDVAGISSLASLTSLDLTDNDITDLTELASLTNLQTIDLSGNDNLLYSDLYALEVALHRRR